jgi:hypothetical protein
MTAPPNFPAPAPRPKPDVGRAGCLAASLAAAPFFLLALGCLVLAVMAFNDTSPRPRPPRQTTTIPGTAPSGSSTTQAPDDPAGTDPTETTTR